MRSVTPYVRIRPKRRQAALIAGLAALVVASCGGGEDSGDTVTTTTPPSPPAAERGDARPREERTPGGGNRGGTDRGGGPPTGPAETGEDDPRLTALEREAAATVRDYVAALDAGDGGRVCRLVAPGALAEFELPRPRGDCERSLSASIGYRDPRGLPVFEGAEIADLGSLEIEPGQATVIATIVTSFADRAEPSIEDDIVHMTRASGRWLIAKPSATLYRAVGIADVPPSVLAPPGSD